MQLRRIANSQILDRLLILQNHSEIRNLPRVAGNLWHETGVPPPIEEVGAVFDGRERSFRTDAAQVHGKVVT